MSDGERLEERLRALGAAPDAGADWDDVLRRAGGRFRARPSRRKLTLVLAAAIVVAASLTGVFATSGTRPGVTGGSSAWEQNGRQVTIDELRAEAPYVPLPSSELANDGNVGTIWIWDHTSDPTVPEGHVVAADVQYPGSGIELLWTRGGFGYVNFPTRLVDGVRASLIPGGWSYNGPTGSKGPTGATGPTGVTGTGAKEPRPDGPLQSWLRLPVGPDAVLSLVGRVPESELIDVAQALSPSPGDASPAGGLPPSNPQPGQDLTFWDGPPSYGVSMGSVDAGAGSLTFQPVAPSSLGHPSAILETDPAQAPQSDRVLSLRYDDAPKASFWLVERPSLTTTTSVLREIASDCTRTSGCRDAASMTELPGGVWALKLDDAFLNRIVWVEGGVYYEVVGSSSTFHPSDALSVAKVTAAAASG